MLFSAVKFQAMKNGLLSLLFLLILFFNACNNTASKEDEALAMTYCSNCHQFPSPLLLDKDNWEKLLVNTTYHTGISNKDSLPYLQRSINKSQLNISEDDWNRIKKYFINQSPYRLNFPLSSTTSPLNDLFKVRVGQTFSDKIPNITCVKIDSATQSAYVCDELNKAIWILDKNGSPNNHFVGHSAISNIEIAERQLLVTYIGKSITPTNNQNGYTQLVNLGNKTQSETLLTKLNRPTQSISVNLDDNPDKELITNEFGLLQGSLSIWKKRDKLFQKQALENTAGAIKTIPVDFDKDGLIDLITLFGQGDERIVLYKNNGNLKFTSATLLSFPPVYGSSYFELADFNKDGLLDIIYTSGDNADYTVELKPYHGVYIFENQGKNRFKQAYFYQMNGAYKAIARDFDLDGDIDIAAIAFYVDYFEKTPKDFVFFENSQQKLIPKSIDIKTYGRWLVMDAGDIDKDGDEDLILGSHPLGVTPGTLLKEWVKSSGALLLINQTINKN